jgi:hypothetical protein
MAEQGTFAFIRAAAGSRRLTISGSTEASTLDVLFVQPGKLIMPLCGVPKVIKVRTEGLLHRST